MAANTENLNYAYISATFQNHVVLSDNRSHFFFAIVLLLALTGKQQLKTQLGKRPLGIGCGLVDSPQELVMKNMYLGVLNYDMQRTPPHSQALMEENTFARGCF